MRSARLVLLAVAGVALAGCMQTGGPFARDAPPLHKQQFVLPAMLKPGAGRTVVAAQPVAPQPVYAEPMPLAPQPVAVVAEPEPSYALDSGDRLRVVVFGQEGLSASYSVDTSGRITMPLIGAVHARGMTPAGLQQAIAAKLKNGFVREPHVAVEVELYRPFFILGEVTLPGQYPYVPNMTVESAVAIAGGFSPRAKRDVVTVTHTEAGGAMRAVVPLGTPLAPGDTVFVGERWF